MNPIFSGSLLPLFIIAGVYSTLSDIHMDALVRQEGGLDCYVALALGPNLRELSGAAGSVGRILILSGSEEHTSVGRTWQQ